MGNTTIANPVANANTVCYLSDTGAGGAVGQSFTSTDATNDNQQSLSIVAPLTSTGSTVDIDCLSDDANTGAYYTHLAVIKLGSVSGTAVHHPSGKTSNAKVTK